MEKITHKLARRVIGMLALCLLLVGNLIPLAQAAILFQDDTFMTVDSDNIMIDANNSNPTGNKEVQFGNSGTDGVLNWVQSTSRFSLSNSLDITGGLTATGGVVDLSAASGNIFRKSTSPNTLANCSTLGEVIVNTTSNRLEVCTATGTPGTWAAPSVTIPQGATNPLTCSVSELFYNTTTNTLNVCTATNTWNIAGPQDFEAVYGYDADKTMTTSNNPFTINTGTGAFTLTSTGATSINGSSTTVKGSGAGATAINLDANDNAAGGITGVWGTGGLNFSGPGGGLTYNATGAYNMTGTGASTLTTGSGNLNLSTTTSGDVAISSAANVTFDDAQLLSSVKLTNTATGWAGTLTGGGIIDNINSFTTYTSGDGASNVGVENGTLGNIFAGGASSNNLQQALNNINGLVGSGAPNNADMTWYPEYPDTVIYKDGTNNLGTLTSDYDSVGSEHFYKWTTTQGTLQDLDLRFRYPLPADFASTGNFTFRFRTQDAINTNDKVDVTVYDVTDATSCGSSAANVNTAWTTATITAATLNAGCAGLSAGDVLEVQVKQYASKTGGTEHWSEIGKINHLYNN